jgi:membrane protease YdiL (CAAX protease family)
VKREPSVLAFALAFPTAMAWLYFVVASPTTSDSLPAPNAAMRLLYASGKVVQFGLPVLWIALVDVASFRSWKPSRRGLGIGILFGALVSLVAVVMYQFLLNQTQVFSGVGERIRSKLSEFGLTTPLGYAGLATFLAVVNSFLEEYYWRWFVFGRLCKYMSMPAAVVVSSLGFMAHHVVVLSVYFPGRFLTIVLPFSLAIAVGGAVWACLYHRTSSILAPWISHLIVDLTVMAIGYHLAFHR